MDKNTIKLAEIVESISGIHKGKTIQDEKIKFHLLMCVFGTEEGQWYVQLSTKNGGKLLATRNLLAKTPKNLL